MTFDKALHTLQFLILSIVAITGSAVAQQRRNPCPSGSLFFNSTGSTRAPATVTIPVGVDFVTIRAIGADGGCLGRGGQGARVNTSQPVVEGDEIVMVVGQAGLQETALFFPDTTKSFCTGGGGTGVFINNELVGLAAGGSGGAGASSSFLALPTSGRGGLCGSDSDLGGLSGVGAAAAGGGLEVSGEGSASVGLGPATGGGACLSPAGAIVGGAGGVDPEIPGIVGGYGCGGGGAVRSAGSFNSTSGGGGGGFIGGSIFSDGVGGFLHDGALSFLAPDSSSTCVEGADSASLESNGSVLICGFPELQLTKSFSDPVVVVGDETDVSLELRGTLSVMLSDGVIEDELPAELEVVNPLQATTTCGDSAILSVTAGGAFRAEGLSLPISAEEVSCSITFRVRTLAVGTFENVIPAFHLTSGQGLSNSQEARATIEVQAFPTPTPTPAPTPAPTPEVSPDPAAAGCEDLQPTQFQIDGAAATLVQLVRTSTRLSSRLASNGVCDGLSNAAARRRRRKAERLYDRVWTTIWSLPNFDFSNCRDSYQTCSTLTNSEQVVSIENDLRELESLITKTLRSDCIASERTKRRRRLLKRAGGLLDTVLDPTLIYAESVLQCE